MQFLELLIEQYCNTKFCIMSHCFELNVPTNILQEARHRGLQLHHNTVNDYSLCHPYQSLINATVISTE